MTLRVAARFQRADQSVREKADEDVTPVNPPKGISRKVVKDFGETGKREDGTKPAPDDIRPKDVFKPLPKDVNVYNYVSKGYKDMERAIGQVPKDKGYDTVKNLSQYLIETKGGGGTPPVE